MEQKTCFVIMGFGIKNNINLDLTYDKIIKPCIITNNLIPYPLYRESQYNAFRCDEISGTTLIDYKFVTCLKGADIVIADISTMNANAIYELGARHALKPRSTILLCAKDLEQEFKFFDLTYVPIIFYEHEGECLASKVIKTTKDELNKYIDFAVNSTTTYPDNPIQRALSEGKMYKNDLPPQESIYKLYLRGKKELDNNDFECAEETFEKLYSKSPSEENLLLWSLAKYKKEEQNRSIRGLTDCINLIIENIDIERSTSEILFGRLAAIYLRIYNLSNDYDYYYLALEHYRLGSTYSKNNLYCPRNYCALLFRIYEITDDVNIIREYYYTAKHYAKLFLDKKATALRFGNYDDRIYYHYNVNDLKSILNNDYINYEKECISLEKNADLSPRQKETIKKGIDKLNNDISRMRSIIEKITDFV